MHALAALRYAEKGPRITHKEPYISPKSDLLTVVLRSGVINEPSTTRVSHSGIINEPYITHKGDLLSCAAFKYARKSLILPPKTTDKHRLRLRRPGASSRHFPGRWQIRRRGGPRLACSRHHVAPRHVRWMSRREQRSRDLRLRGACGAVCALVTPRPSQPGRRPLF